jgi:hypothetical protein
MIALSMQRVGLSPLRPPNLARESAAMVSLIELMSLLNPNEQDLNSQFLTKIIIRYCTSRGNIICEHSYFTMLLSCLVIWLLTEFGKFNEKSLNHSVNKKSLV